MSSDLKTKTCNKIWHFNFFSRNLMKQKWLSFRLSFHIQAQVSAFTSQIFTFPELLHCSAVHGVFISVFSVPDTTGRPESKDLLERIACQIISAEAWALELSSVTGEFSNTMNTFSCQHRWHATATFKVALGMFSNDNPHEATFINFQHSLPACKSLSSP